MLKQFKEQLGIDISSILIPKQGINMNKWSVVACDQYTSEPEYWDKADKYVGDEPSTLKLIFPEVYLEREKSDEKQKRIDKINKSMCEYIDKGYFEEIQNSMIYVERTTQSGKIRKGLLFAIDLEQYDFSKGSKSLIRATEGTILDRLPPRICIREKACLELPHIMLLVDDPDHTTIEPVSSCKDSMKQLYSFDLMMNGGHIEGYQVNDIKQLQNIYNSLIQLKSSDTFSKKYNVDGSSNPLLFAVGDGNHSLATAKSCWEKIKKSLSDKDRSTHPARFALVELVNVHDFGLEFEPIHRILFNVKANDLLSAFVRFYEEKGLQCGFEYVDNMENIPKNSSLKHILPFVHNAKTGYAWVNKPIYTMDVGTLQHFLDNYLKENKNVEIDYVHGNDVIDKLGRRDRNMGFLLSPMDKGNLFKTVILEGALPRKTFSMGEANEKRYYLECRQILPNYLR